MPEVNKKIYHTSKQIKIDTSENITNFLEDYASLCKMYNLSLSHEDEHGGFIIEECTDDNIKWVFEASTNVNN